MDYTGTDQLVNVFYNLSTLTIKKILCTLVSILFRSEHQKYSDACQKQMLNSTMSTSRRKWNSQTLEIIKHLQQSAVMKVQQQPQVEQ